MKAAIYFEDAEDGDVNIRIEFGDGGSNDNSGAHRSAMLAASLLVKNAQQEANSEDEEAA